jgi:hypothetical protein
MINFYLKSNIVFKIYERLIQAVGEGSEGMNNSLGQTLYEDYSRVNYLDKRTQVIHENADTRMLRPVRAKRIAPAILNRFSYFEESILM